MARCDACKIPLETSGPALPEMLLPQSNRKAHRGCGTRDIFSASPVSKSAGAIYRYLRHGAHNFESIANPCGVGGGDENFGN
jgi:hypothetical protein